jgi:hypothetical protein
MKLNKYNINKNLVHTIVDLLDLILLMLVISFLINDLFCIIFSIFDKIYNLISLNDIMCFMNNNTNNTSTGVVHTNINTQIIHDDGSWSNAIRSLFIYGTGGYRL